MRSAVFIPCLMISSAAIAAGHRGDRVDGPAIPANDVKATCGKLDDSESRAYCVRSEQFNYDVLKSLWPKASARAKQTSISNATPMVGSSLYYDALLTCLRAEMRSDENAMDWASPPKFSR